jgi:hypothetical protein
MGKCNKEAALAIAPKKRAVMHEGCTAPKEKGMDAW